MLNSGKRRGSSDEREARNEVRLAISGLRIKIKILRAHHRRTAYDFLKKKRCEKIWAQMSALPPNKNKMGIQKRTNPTSCAFFISNVPIGFKTRIRKSLREIESNLEKDGRKKNESTVGAATIM